MALEPPDLSRLVTVVEHERTGGSRRGLARGVLAGSFERLRPGIMRADPDAGDPASPDAHRRRYLDEVIAVCLKRRSRVVVSGPSAAAVWGFPYFPSWPQTIHLLTNPDSAIRSRARVKVHRNPFSPDDVVAWGPFLVTSPARTVIDLARAGDELNAVLALDHCLAPNAPVDHRLVKEDCAALLRRSPGEWGRARAEWAIDFADGAAANGGESASRVLIHRLGFPVPELQKRHLVEGRIYFSDFAWPRPGARAALIGEFDGMRKYLAPAFGAHRSPRQILQAEKEREDALRRAGFDVVRWGHRELLAPDLLRQRLLRAGLRPKM